eukprot:3269989-Prorocentrum_lima.AAC.1
MCIRDSSIMVFSCRSCCSPFGTFLSNSPLSSARTKPDGCRIRPPLWRIPRTNLIGALLFPPCTPLQPRDGVLPPHAPGSFYDVPQRARTNQ